MRLQCACSAAAAAWQLVVDTAVAVPTGIPQLVKRLQARGTAVYLVSGGFRQIIEPIAESLGIPVSNVFANRLLFQAGARAVPVDLGARCPLTLGTVLGCLQHAQKGTHQHAMLVMG